nr:uncharacterized protein LOC117466868 [Pseudochaenichthys georgianus]
MTWLVIGYGLSLQSPSDLGKEQKNDPTLQALYSQVLPDEEFRSAARGYFLQDGLLVRKWVPQGDCFMGEEVVQVVLPSKLRLTVLQTAHDGIAGHLGVKKTYNRVGRYFYWPLLKKDIAAFIKTCNTCQLTGKPNQVIKPAPLYPIPVVGNPFEHLIVDCVGPLPRSKAGNNFLLTVMCQATRYPAAYPLRNITTRSVVKALTQFITIFGLPKIIQSDQGTNFTSKLFAEVLQQLNIKHSQSSAYHPQSQGALERFHQSLKSLLRSYCTELEDAAVVTVGHPSPSLDVGAGVKVEEEYSPDDGLLRGRLKNSESLANLGGMLGHLTEPRRTELVDLVKNYPCLFGDTPSRTHLIEHDIEVGDAKPAFEAAKTVLCSAPVLAAPQMDQPFILHVDASKVGAGAVLAQVDESGSECPVGES